MKNVKTYLFRLAVRVPLASQFVRERAATIPASLDCVAKLNLGQCKRLGFTASFNVPDDFDGMGAAQTAGLLCGSSRSRRLANSCGTDWRIRIGKQVTGDLAIVCTLLAQAMLEGLERITSAARLAGYPGAIRHV